MQISMQMYAIFTTASSVRNKRRAIYDYSYSLLYLFEVSSRPTHSRHGCRAPYQVDSTRLCVVYGARPRVARGAVWIRYGCTCSRRRAYLAVRLYVGTVYVILRLYIRI